MQCLNALGGLSKMDVERNSLKSPLAHYRFCRNLFLQFVQEDRSNAHLSAFRRALRYPYARNYPPSIAVLSLLAHLLGEVHEPIIPCFSTSGAPLGQKEGEGAILPLPICRELACFWKELGTKLGDEELIAAAIQCRDWASRFSPLVDLLYYPEQLFSHIDCGIYHDRSKTLNLDCVKTSGFDEKKGACISCDTSSLFFVEPQEFSRCPNSQFLTDRGINKYCGSYFLEADASLGMLASATPSVESCFTLSGWNSGLGAIRFGSARICAFGPQMGSQGDSQFFGLAQFPLNVGAPCDGRLEGWTRCFGAREVWLHLNARVDTERVVFGVRFLGIGSGNTVRMVFYVDADSCTLEDGTVLRPGNLQRARQKGLSILFNESVQFACSESFEMEIIPLAGQGCYWDSSFLVSFEFNSFLDRCVYSVCFV